MYVCGCAPLIIELQYTLKSRRGQHCTQQQLLLQWERESILHPLYHVNPLSIKSLSASIYTLTLFTQVYVENKISFCYRNVAITCAVTFTDCKYITAMSHHDLLFKMMIIGLLNANKRQKKNTNTMELHEPKGCKSCIFIDCVKRTVNKGWPVPVLSELMNAAPWARRIVPGSC